jgi:hypothetical protein
VSNGTKLVAAGYCGAAAVVGATNGENAVSVRVDLTGGGISPAVSQDRPDRLAPPASEDPQVRRRPSASPAGSSRRGGADHVHRPPRDDRREAPSASGRRVPVAWSRPAR